MRFNRLCGAAKAAAGLFALAGMASCSPTGESRLRPVLDPSPPASRDVLPRHASLLEGPPLAITQDALAGHWRSDACILHLASGDTGAAAHVTGDCPSALGEITRWRLEPEQRLRLDLLGGDGEAPLWSGLMTRPGRLAGHARGIGGWVWTRDGAPASTRGAGPQ